MNVCSLWSAFGVLCAYSNYSKEAETALVSQQDLMLVISFPNGGLKSASSTHSCLKAAWLLDTPAEHKASCSFVHLIT